MTGAKGSNTGDLPCSPRGYRPHRLVKIAQQRSHPEVGDGAQQTRYLLAGKDGRQWVGLARQRDASRLLGPVEDDGVEERKALMIGQMLRALSLASVAKSEIFETARAVSMT